MTRILILIAFVFISCRSEKHVTATKDVSKLKQDIAFVDYTVSTQSVSDKLAKLIDSTTFVAEISWLSRPDTTGKQYVRKKATVSVNKKVSAVQHNIDSLSDVQRTSSVVDKSEKQHKQQSDNKDVKVYKPPLWIVSVLIIVVILFIKYIKR